MKNINIKFVDFYEGFNYKDFYLYTALCKKYNVKISDNPDYIIFSDHGHEYLKYDCIRIYYTPENMRPNFNQCDYAIGFDYITFEDRYLRYPIYLAFNYYINTLKLAMKKHNLNNDNLIKRKFCNMVVSNGLNSNRLDFYKKLCKYKMTDSGGKLLNNVGGPVKSKLEFQKKYKFCLAFENSSSNGYTTEKIIDSFAARCIPIYWGDPLIDKIFNNKSFINAKNFENTDKLIDYIKKIDNDDNLYLKYLKEPIIKNSKYIEEEQKMLNKFLENIFEQNYNQAKRRTEGQWVLQEKRELLLVQQILNFAKPFLKFKSYIKNKLIH
jgi:hypothetical protein